MKIKLFALLAALLLLGAGCSAEKESAKKEFAAETPKVKDANQQNQSIIPSDMEIPKKITLGNQKNLAAEYSRAKLKTNYGDITVEFYAADSPVTVNNFLNLAEQGFYNDTSFHRVIKDFMIQGGDPNSKDQDNRVIHGMGGPDYKFEDEINNHKLVRGSLAMANNSVPNTNGSQFFIVTAESTPWLDGKHTNFGFVVEGMNVVDKIENVSVDQRDNPFEPIVIKSIELIK